ncbi:protein of unknown function [Cupriavidus taiwanensis]|uniref:Uncharacterized protein n=1 Tax=Cupriavidus taiwanensis TaxID=164546 RepID=A0A375I7Q1_9BURK|nr:protein of unknown function [Cupriavidus taiwanensis]
MSGNGNPSILGNLQPQRSQRPIAEPRYAHNHAIEAAGLCDRTVSFEGFKYPSLLPKSPKILRF